jgi:hypothetical protein
MRDEVPSHEKGTWARVAANIIILRWTMGRFVSTMKYPNVKIGIGTVAHMENDAVE